MLTREAMLPEYERARIGSVSELHFARARGAAIAAVSGSGRWLMENAGITPDIYGCLEKDNLDIYSRDMEFIRAMNPLCRFYFSVYASEKAANRDVPPKRYVKDRRVPWNIVPESERIIVSEDVVYPRYIETPYLKGTVTGGVLLALRLAWEGIWNPIHMFAMEGYGVGKVYTDGVVGNSDKTDEQWRRDTNESAAGAIEWMTNKYSDIIFVMHGNPVHKRESWKCRYQK